jgi:(hydroxyamino)benzene mutase
MSRDIVKQRQGHQLLWVGIATFVLACLWGFAIPFVALPSTALTTHRLGFLLGLITLVLGLMWPRLQFDVTAARLASCSYVYAVAATLLGYALAAIWGAGGSALPIASDATRGSATQEIVIDVLLGSASILFLATFAMMLSGLRLREKTSDGVATGEHSWRVREQA